jgi:hypothetical protein
MDTDVLYVFPRGWFKNKDNTWTKPIRKTNLRLYFGATNEILITVISVQTKTEQNNASENVVW